MGSIERRPILALLMVMGCQSPATPGEPLAQLSGSAEQLMVGVSTNLTADGARRGSIVADSAFVYQEARRIDFRRVRATLFDGDGQPTAVLTAQRAVYRGDEETLDAVGDVLIVSTAGDSLRSAQVVYDKRRMQFSSDSAFTHRSPKTVARGTGFTADLRLKGVTPKP
jgi:LPS export ABC transporter protein LptC